MVKHFSLYVVDSVVNGRLLERELRQLQKVSEVRETEMQSQINALKAETERQNKLIGQVVKLAVSICLCVSPVSDSNMLFLHVHLPFLPE